MSTSKRIILMSLLIWLCVWLAGSFRFGDPLGAAVFVTAPVTYAFPNTTGDLPRIVVSIYLVILSVLAVIAWRGRSTYLSGVFCLLLLSSVIFGWVMREIERRFT